MAISTQPSRSSARARKLPRTESPTTSAPINAALPNAYEKAVVDGSVVPLGQPEIEVTKLEDGDVVEFTAELDVRPDFDVPAFADLAVNPAKGWAGLYEMSPDKHGILVACGSGSLLLTELQKAGGKRLPVAQFLAGHGVSAGARFELPAA